VVIYFDDSREGEEQKERAFDEKRERYAVGGYEPTPQGAAEHEAWRSVVAQLLDAGAVTCSDLRHPLHDRDSSAGLRLLDSIRAWGVALVSVNEGLTEEDLQREAGKLGLCVTPRSGEKRNLAMCDDCCGWVYPESERCNCD
jgi:hypothetical protein